jgi:hypothetical protein
VAGTLGLSCLLTGGTLLRTAWDQRDAELAYDKASRRVRYVEEPVYQQRVQHPGGNAWVHVRRF